MSYVSEEMYAWGEKESKSKQESKRKKVHTLFYRSTQPACSRYTHTRNVNYETPLEQNKPKQCMLLIYVISYCSSEN